MKKLTYPALEELERLRAKVEHRKGYLELLELELFNTRKGLQEFTEAYNARLGELEKELNRLQHLMEARFEEEEKLREALPGGEKKKGWRFYGRPQADDDEKDSKAKLANKDPEFEKKIRELFRNLAKRFHPDLAEGKRDKNEREKIMARINQAYSARDLRSLEKLTKQVGARDSGNAIGPQAEILRNKVELRQLETMIFEVEHTIREIDLSPALQLRNDLNFEKEAGRDFFADIESNIIDKIKEISDHLLELGVDERLVAQKK